MTKTFYLVCNLQLYCGKFLGNHHIMSAGGDQNMLKILDKQTLQVTFFYFMFKKQLVCFNNYLHFIKNFRCVN